MRIGNTTYNVDWLKSVTLTEAKKTSIPHIEEAWRKVNGDKPKSKAKSKTKNKEGED